MFRYFVQIPCVELTKEADLWVLHGTAAAPSPHCRPGDRPNQAVLTKSLPLSPRGWGPGEVRRMLYHFGRGKIRWQARWRAAELRDTKTCLSEVSLQPLERLRTGGGEKGPAPEQPPSLLLLPRQTPERESTFRTRFLTSPPCQRPPWGLPAPTYQPAQPQQIALLMHTRVTVLSGALERVFLIWRGSYKLPVKI